ncbi:MAG: hypothetical protein K0S80_4019, partial [Neobacillus sp.]|nr:hypothetical protein [Neobacillus sp.]
MVLCNIQFLCITIRILAINPCQIGEFISVFVYSMYLLLYNERQIGLT